jgi:hypothetical protein
LLLLWRRSGGFAMKNDGSKLRKKAADILEPGEDFVAATTLNTGSITRAAFGGTSAPIVKAGLTDRRILLFASNNLAFNLNVGKLVGTIQLADIASVEYSTGWIVKINLTLKDGSVLPFEASGVTAKSASEFASVLESTVNGPASSLQ